MIGQQWRGTIILTPYHHNETGSRGGKTLTVRGASVPLIEGHDRARGRWTANDSSDESDAAVAEDDKVDAAVAGLSLIHI